MKHLTSYKDHIQASLDNMEVLDKYIGNPNNFPEIETINDIFKDVSDLYYLNSLPKPFISNEIFRIIGNKSRKIQRLKDEIYRDSAAESNAAIDDLTYYKSHMIFLPKYSNKVDKFEKEIKEKVLDTIKRLKNYGFFIERVDNIYRGIFIYIIDKGNPITLKEILNETSI